MDWVLGRFTFRGKPFRAWHFDVCSGSPTDGGGREDGEAAPCICGAQRESLEVAEGEIGAVLWSEAAEACLQCLQDGAKSYSGRKVLELGAGCGYVGLALACDGAEVSTTTVIRLNAAPRCSLRASLDKHKRPRGTRATHVFRAEERALESHIHAVMANMQVTITDVEALKPLLALNEALGRQDGHIVHHCTLDWGKPIPGHLKPDFDLVLGCDLLYDSASPRDLLRILQYFVIGNTEFRLSVNLRDNGKGLQNLMEAMEKDFFCSVKQFSGVSVLLALRK